MRIPINKSPVAPAPAPNAVVQARLPVLADIMRPQDNNFALVRLLMALAVLVSHSWWLATGRTSAEPLHSWTHHSLGEHAVQVFFFLSGVVVAQSLLKSKSVLDFICARALRIFPALIVCVLVTAFLLGPVVTALDLKTYFTDTGLITYILKTVSLSTGSAPLPGVFETNPVPRLVNLSLWTLKYEVLCYALLAVFGALYLALPKLRTALTVVLGLVVALIFLGDPKPPSSYTALDNMRYFIVFFGMGALAYLIRERLVLSWLILPLLFLGFVFAIGTRFAELASAFFLGYGTLLFASLKLPRLRWFTNDQDYSYAVYILHCPIQQALIQLRPGIDPIELTLITIALVMPLSVFSWTHIERPAMATRKTLVAWLRSLRPETKPVDVKPVQSPSRRLASRVEAVASGGPHAATTLNLREASVEVIKPGVQASLADNAAAARDLKPDTTVDRMPESKPGTRPNLARSSVAEWFSQKRKADQHPIAAAVSEQLAERIKAAARVAATDKRSTTADAITTAPAAHSDAVVIKPAMSPRKRMRRIVRVRAPVIVPIESAPHAAEAPPVSSPKPTRMRGSRIATQEPTKLWARRGRITSTPDAAEPVPSELDEALEAEVVISVSRATERPLPAGSEIADLTPAPKPTAPSASPRDTATAELPAANAKERLRERIGQVVTRHEASNQRRPAKPRRSPIQLA